MVNQKAYEIGKKAFEQMLDDSHPYSNYYSDDEEELLKDVAWRAFMNDNTNIDDYDLGYYTICRVYGVDNANDYYSYYTA